MNFLNTLLPWQWAVLAAVPPAIVALYFLKLKRQPLEVPSTYLWHKSIEDLHVNSLWQKIRQSLLLYLQLLLVLLVFFALIRPGWRGGQSLGERAILLIDNSASMNATDVGPTRLAEAKRQATELIEGMAGGDKAMVVSFSDVARVEQGFTENRRDLLRAVENIRPTQRTTQLDEALRAAAGLANPGRVTATDDNEDVAAAQSAKLFILSDGRFPSVEGFSLGALEPVFMPIGKPTAVNVGIVAFGVRRNEEREDRLQAFGNVENFGDDEVSVKAELLLNGTRLDLDTVKVPAHGTTGVKFDLGEIDSGILELRLDSADALPDDNRAWAAVNASRRPKVLLVTAGNEPLELGLSTGRAAELAEVSKATPDVLKTDAHRQAAAAGMYDLIVYDRCAPETLPRANTLFIAAVPPRLKEDAQAEVAKPQAATGENAPPDTLPPSPAIKWWSLGESAVYPQIIDVDRAHPLTEWLDLGDVDIAEAKPVTTPTGGTRLVDANIGTLLAIAPREGFEDAVLGFEIYGLDKNGERYANTNWPIRRSFPAFLYGVLAYLGGNDGARAGETLRPGAPVLLKGDGTTPQLAVRTPHGATLTAPRGKGGSYLFSETAELGPYEVRDGDKTTERFTVNLFDPLESDIRPAANNSIQIGFVPVEGSGGTEPVRKEIWKWLLGFGLIVLLVEWYVYNRRVYV